VIKQFFSLFIGLSILGSSPLMASVDLEINPHSFVIDLQKIDINGYPDAFNPSIVRWNDSLLMSFRQVIEPSTIPSASESIVGLVWLDDNFNPISDPFILNFGMQSSRIDDVRLTRIGDTVHIVYSANIDDHITEGGYRMWSAKLEFDGTQFFIHDKHRLAYFDGEIPEKREKNWTPFDYCGFLHFVYSITPHLVFLPLAGTECCYTVGKTHADLHWMWGELRGGTPALKVDNRYLTFFHSSILLSSIHSEGQMIPHYFIGAYTFADKPPFEITHISRKPIIAKGFYSGATYDHYWQPVCVVFPAGMLIEDDTIWLTFGRQDHEIWVAKIDKPSLLDSLHPVTPSHPFRANGDLVE